MDFLHFVKLYFLKNKINTIVWDFDGTLYQNEKIDSMTRKLYFRLVSLRGVSEEEFEIGAKNHKSWSAYAAFILKKSEFEVMNIVDSKLKKGEHIARDQKIVRLFKNLSKYRHIIFSNSKTSDITECLMKIGFSKDEVANSKLFCNIIGRDKMLCLKPSAEAFQYIFNLHKGEKNNYLLIGDSTFHDIKPARKFGFHAFHIDKIRPVFSILHNR